MEKIRLAVIGATAAGIAAAKAFGPGAVVFEKGILAGAEFGAAMFAEPGTVWPRNELYNRLLAVRAVDEAGGFHPAGLGQALWPLISEAGLDVRLYTRVTAVNPCAGGSVLTLYDSEGCHACVAEKVLITTHDAQPFGRIRRWSVKSLSACIGGGEGDISGLRREDMEILRSSLPSERILRVWLDDADGWPQARERLHAVWKREWADELSGWKLAAASSQFGYAFDAPVRERLADGVTFLPSASFGNPASAFEGGAACVTDI